MKIQTGLGSVDLNILEQAAHAGGAGLPQGEQSFLDGLRQGALVVVSRDELLRLTRLVPMDERREISFIEALHMRMDPGPEGLWVEVQCPNCGTLKMIGDKEEGTYLCTCLRHVRISGGEVLGLE